MFAIPRSDGSLFCFRSQVVVKELREKSDNKFYFAEFACLLVEKCITPTLVGKKKERKRSLLLGIANLGKID